MDTRLESLDDFGPWLKRTGKEKHVTQRDIAKYVGVTEASVSRWVRGERYPNKRQMEKILKFLGCHIEIQEDA